MLKLNWILDRNSCEQFHAAMLIVNTYYYFVNFYPKNATMAFCSVGIG